MRKDAAERTRLLAMAHVGAKRLGLDEDTRRALQQQMTGCPSCADMTLAQLRTLVAELNRRGARLTPKRPAGPSPDRAPLVRKVEAMARSGGYPHPEYALGISRRMWGAAAPGRIEWHTPKQLRALVAALTYDRRRRPPPASA